MSENISYHPSYRPDANEGEPRASKKAQTIAITSGKGGVGKTNITTNLGIALATRHAKVCIFDADTNLANINILLGLSPKYTLEHLLNGERTLDEIITEGPRGIHLIPAASGIAKFTSLGEEQRAKLAEALKTLESRYDYLIMDTGAGVGDTVLSFLQAAQQSILVISPEPTSLTDAFSLIKVMQKRGVETPLHVLVNMALNRENSLEVFKRFENAVTKYLHKKVNYLGFVPLDENIISSVSLQQPVIIQKPTSEASCSFFELATKITEKILPDASMTSFSDSLQESPIQPIEPELPATASSSSTPAATPSSPDELLKQLVDHLENNSTTPEEADGIAHQVLESFYNRFHQFPGDAKKTLYRALENGQISDDETPNLVYTLEQVYEKRTGESLRDPYDSMIQLLSNVEGSENALRSLHKLIEDSYKRQFEQSLFDPRREMIRQLRNPQSSEDDFFLAIDAIKKTYQERFGKPLLDEKDKALENIRGITEQMHKKESELMSGISRMSEWFNETIEAREKLMHQVSPLLNKKQDKNVSSTDESDQDSE